jgi:hypothetical protein
MVVPVPKLVTFSKMTKSTRGRPRVVHLLPVTPEIGAIQAHRDAFVKADPLLKTIRKDTSTIEVADQIMATLAEEIASLSFEELDMRRSAKDSTHVSGKKITALRSLADLYFKKRESIAGKTIDFKSLQFEKFMEWVLVSVVRESALESKLTDEQINILFDNIANKFTDDRWTEKALAHIQS